MESYPGDICPPWKMQGATMTLFGDGPLGEALQASPKMAFQGPSNLTQYMEDNDKFLTWTNVTEPDQLQVAEAHHDINC